MRISLIALSSALALSACATVPAQTASPAMPEAAGPQPLSASIPSDLPRGAAPSHYRIHIVPDIANLTFAGRGSIELEVFEPIDALVLHANDLEITEARLYNHAGGTRSDFSQAFDAEKQTVSFSDGTIIQPGRYRFDTVYTGTINQQANGLFALDYPDKRTGEPTRSLFTQFEAPDARRFAPMFDEPSYKATFDLSADVPANMMAVGNMPVKSEEPMGALKRVTFDTSPKMSSYLLFFALGDFERITDTAADGTVTGIVSPAGSGEQARYALESLTPLNGWFNDYFGVDYPLPKLDNVAAPGSSQFFGAMENWGSILTFESILLFDPANSTASTRQSIYAVQAHEVAHQWFGNIVTMAWWDDLWLNEGFASWMETKTTARFNPDWYPLLGRVGARESAMRLDAFPTTHPVIQEIRTVEQTNQAFDQITYSKGEAVISMFEAFAGEDVWRDGIRRYMARHQYGNTVSEDLWRAVEEAGATGLVDVARDFTTKAGIPLVTLNSATCSGGKTTLAVSQGEYRRGDWSGVTEAAPDWRIPLLISIDGAAPQRRVFGEQSATYTLDGCGTVELNAGQLGYFRTLYPAAEQAKLAASMRRQEPIDQLGMIADAQALGVGGYQGYAPALDLLAAMPVDANPVVLQTTAGDWGGYHGLLKSGGQDEAAAKLAGLIRTRFRPVLDSLGYEPSPDETIPESNLRSTLLGIMAAAGDESVQAEASRRFALLASDPAALDGPLKSRWLGIVASKATPEQWELLLKLASESTNTAEQRTYYNLLGAAEDEALARRTLQLALSGEVPLTVAAQLAGSVAQSNGDLAANFVLDNRATIDALVDNSGRSGFYARLFYGARDPATIARIEAYRDSLSSDAQRPVNQALDAIAERQAGQPRAIAEVAAWVMAQ
ncbi:M1 family aminopeptidase [Alteriqipengyuania flavescens]|uniref:M1 family metallopeptidase n=1 Tax=Alteriqipengyuania flavescens TaxID=3053610 RepID=UPI0025B46E06|nr:M1 family metallopeptidase [Alteriqipengyuania flavescens]WJY19373.1 M1 family aminopeptidase [Alteriqipengyuania flavescens]WJY25315.1 M1 family aminopeptidase [Alteriqipengyuania flavescens]